LVSTLPNIQTGSWERPTFSSINNGGSFPRGKIATAGYKYMELYLHSPYIIVAYTE